MSASRKIKPNYIGKKRRRRIKKTPLILIAVLLLGLISFGGYNVLIQFLNREPSIIEYKLGSLNVKESKEILSKTNNEDGEYQIVDYQLYGESLGLYTTEYNKDNKDELVNKSVMLRNMENQETLFYLLTSDIDKQIPIYELMPGVYEVFVSSVLKDERIYMPTKTYDEFYTITRNNKNYKVKFVADTNYFYPHDETMTLDKNYLYLVVEEAQLPDDYYDILIDPGHHTYDYGPILERGHAANGLIEAEETLKAAQVMAQELSAAGLKVKLVREDNDVVVDTYGADGRIGQVFKSQAHYYISNHLNSLNDKSVHGTEVYYSSYASSTLAETVLNSIVENTDLVASGYIGNGNSIPSVVPDRRILSSRTNTYHDSYMMIREPGGRSTGAGERSDEAYEKNYPLIQGTHYGAQAILIEYLYISNSSDATKWKENYAEYAKAASQGIIEYLKLDINNEY